MLHWQNNLVHPEGEYSLRDRIDKDGSLENTKKVLEASRNQGMFVIYVKFGWRKNKPELPEKIPEVFGYFEKSKRDTWDTEIVSELEPTDKEITLYNFGSDCFEGTELDKILRANKINHLYLTGQVLEHVIATNVRRAANIGYEVTLLKDCTSPFEEKYEDCMLEILSYYGELITSADFVSSLEE